MGDRLIAKEILYRFYTMGKTEMIKVYFPSWQLWIFSLMINLLVLAVQPRSALSQAQPSQSASQQAANTSTSNTATALEPEILSEINRVRTNPQDYAQWLESQRQYYDGIWLKLPGEKPVRTNKGKQVLEEAIAFLKEQSPLPPVATSEQTAASATSELANFANASNIQYFSYGRKTAKGIVMDLVVDELFPDRRRRQSLLSPEAEDTGVACKPDPRYAKVCAIAFSDSPITRDVAQTNSDASNTSDVAVAKPEASTPPDNEVAKQPQAAPKPGNDTANAAEPAPKPEPAPEPPAAPKATPTPPSAETNEVATGSLPVPPQPQAPPTPSPSSESQADADNEQEAETVPVDESKKVEEEAAAIEQEDINEETAPEAVVNSDANNDAETEVEEETAAAVEDDSEQVAINSENAGIQERVEQGALEDGDRVIEDDGSLYDFYPIEGKKGDSLTINLASDEFDAFVALVDSNGNTVDENDDISQSDSNSELKVTLPADGVYNVIVNTYDEQGKGEYVLTVGQ
jgi:hypothetical protein